jgi:RsiW-degrading membrane proteinase PrsW (M82 family)
MPGSDFGLPNVFLLVLGAISLSIGVIGTRTGKIMGRFGRAVHRAENPTMFRLLVAACFLGGVLLLIGYFSYWINSPSK